MNAADALHGEMPGFLPGRPGGEHDEPLLDMLLERRPIPPGAPPEMHDLACMLAAVAGPAEHGELAGEATVLTAFARLASPAGVSPVARRSARRRLSGRPARGRLPVAAVLVAAAAGLGSTAAYALPGPIQHFAHAAVGALDGTRDSPERAQAASGPRGQAHHPPGAAASRKHHRATLSPGRSSSGRVKPPHKPADHGRQASTPTCTPRPDPPQRRPHPVPTQSWPWPVPAPPSPPAPGLGASLWPSPSPAAASCPAVPAPTAAPRPG